MRSATCTSPRIPAPAAERRRRRAARSADLPLCHGVGPRAPCQRGNSATRRIRAEWAQIDSTNVFTISGARDSEIVVDALGRAFDIPASRWKRSLGTTARVPASPSSPRRQSWRCSFSSSVRSNALRSSRRCDAMRRESRSSRWPAIAFTYQFAVAWIMACAGCRIASMTLHLRFEREPRERCPETVGVREAVSRRLPRRGAGMEPRRSGASTQCAESG